MGNNLGTAALRPGTQLLEAAKTGNSELASNCLARSIKSAYSAQNWGGQTAWHVAARHGHVGVLRAMVDILHYAPAGPEQLKPLLKLGKSTEAIIMRLINDQDGKGLTPLILACIYDHSECAEYLMQMGANPFIMDSLGRTALHYAASLGHVGCINALLGQYSSPRDEWDIHLPNTRNTKLVDVRAMYGFTPLHYAVWGESLPAIQALASYEASLACVNTASDYDWITCGEGYTPLHLAALKGDFDVVKTLLAAHVQIMSADADVLGSNAPPVWGQRSLGDPRRMRNKRGLMPYHIAVSKGFTNLSELLHPDIPYQFIFSNDDIGTSSRMFGPPRLAVLSATALQQKLIGDVQHVCKALKQQSAAAAQRRKHEREQLQEEHKRQRRQRQQQQVEQQLADQRQQDQRQQDQQQQDQQQQQLQQSKPPRKDGRPARSASQLPPRPQSSMDVSAYDALPDNSQGVRVPAPAPATQPAQQLQRLGSATGQQQWHEVPSSAPAVDGVGSEADASSSTSTAAAAASSFSSPFAAFARMGQIGRRSMSSTRPPALRPTSPTPAAAAPATRRRPRRSKSVTVAQITSGLLGVLDDTGSASGGSFASMHRRGSFNVLRRIKSVGSRSFPDRLAAKVSDDDTSPPDSPRLHQTTEAEPSGLDVVLGPVTHDLPQLRQRYRLLKLSSGVLRVATATSTQPLSPLGRSVSIAVAQLPDARRNGGGSADTQDSAASVYVGSQFGAPLGRSTSITVAQLPGVMQNGGDSADVQDSAASVHVGGQVGAARQQWQQQQEKEEEQLGQPGRQLLGVTPTASAQQAGEQQQQQQEPGMRMQRSMALPAWQGTLPTILSGKERQPEDILDAAAAAEVSFSHQGMAPAMPHSAATGGSAFAAAAAAAAPATMPAARAADSEASALITDARTMETEMPGTAQACATAADTSGTSTAAPAAVPAAEGVPPPTLTLPNLPRALSDWSASMAGASPTTLPCTPGAADDGASLGEAGCEICFDHEATVGVLPCAHRLCSDCSEHLCQLHHFKPALCPFCRCIISGFGMATIG